MFLVATAAAKGRVNVAAKGMDTLRVVGPDRILWFNGAENVQPLISFFPPFPDSRQILDVDVERMLGLLDGDVPND